jgi:hypothetical protein
MQARDLGLTRPVKDGDNSGGAGSGGNPRTCEKNDYHGSKATVREQRTLEAEAKQRELKGAKRAKRNAMERDRERESRYKLGRVPRETLKKVLLLPTKVMKARRTLAMEQATGWRQFGTGAQQDAK